ncbi:MAG: P-loop NTPase [Planctomycetota bacterium]
MNGQARALLLPRPPRPERTPPWIAVSGGKGGVGKTLVAVNLALGLQKLGHRTLLVDADPGLANIDVHLRLSASHDLEDLADGTCEPWEAVVDGPAQLRVVLGRSGSTRLAGGDADVLRRALAGVATAARGCDVVVCDTGAGIGPAVLEVCRQARLTLAVTTPDPAAITDTYALGKVLRQHGLPVPHLVVNQVRSLAQARGIAERLGGAVERFLSVPLPHLGSLRHDPGMARSVVEQRPFAAFGTGAPIDDLRALAVAAAAVLGLGAPAMSPPVALGV